MATPDATPVPTRWKVVGGSVTSEEFEEVQAAVQQAGYKNRSAFVRETVLERARQINRPRQGGRRRADSEEKAA